MTNAYPHLLAPIKIGKFVLQLAASFLSGT